jgi:hypothetical protein
MSTLIVYVKSRPQGFRFKMAAYTFRDNQMVVDHTDDKGKRRTTFFPMNEILLYEIDAVPPPPEVA